ncbi:MAG: hypothetical protein R3C20_06120 [Planctomycetaceae bacterium]
MAKRRSKSYKSQLTKAGKNYVDLFSASSDWSLSEYLDRTWKDAQQFLDTAAEQSRCQTLAEGYPEFPREHISELGMLFELRTKFENEGVARRVLCDDVAEMEILRAHYRLWFALRSFEPPGIDIRHLLFFCGVGEVEFAKELAMGRRGANTLFLHSSEMVWAATTAMLNRQYDTVRLIIDKANSFRRNSFTDREWNILKLFQAALDRDSRAVADLLNERVEQTRRQRIKPGFEEVVALDAHGLYWLLADIDPSLLSDFDPTRGHPWDAEFHDWCVQNPANESILGGSAPHVVRDVLQRNTPTWMPQPAPLYDVILCEGDVENAALVQVVDECFDCHNVYDPKRVFGILPTTVYFETSHKFATKVAGRITAAGGKAEVRMTEGTPYQSVLNH